MTQHQKDDIQHVVTGQCMTHLQVAVYVTVHVFSVHEYVTVLCSFSINASVIVLLCIHAQSVCVHVRE